MAHICEILHVLMVHIIQTFYQTKKYQIIYVKRYNT